MTEDRAGFFYKQLCDAKCDKVKLKEEQPITSTNFFEKYNILGERAIDEINRAYEEAYNFLFCEAKPYDPHLVFDFDRVWVHYYNLVRLVTSYNEICWIIGEQKTSVRDILLYILNHNAIKKYSKREGK